DIIVKVVMGLLLVASIWCWAIIFDKWWRITRLQRRAKMFERDFWSGAPLDELYRRLGKRPDHPMALMFATAMDEWREAPDIGNPTAQRGVIDRVGRVMNLTL